MYVTRRFNLLNRTEQGVVADDRLVPEKFKLFEEYNNNHNYK